MIQIAVVIAGLALGSVWNCLCLFGVLSLAWQASLVPVGLSSLFVLIPRLFPSLLQKRGESKQTPEREEEKKVLAAASIAFLAAWALTAAACLVYLR